LNVVVAELEELLEVLVELEVFTIFAHPCIKIVAVTVNTSKSGRFGMVNLPH
jgi:hypothetical protein